MDTITELERQIERRESLRAYDTQPGQRLGRVETHKYNFYAKAFQPNDPDFVVVRTSRKTAVVTFFMETGKLRPVTKELPLDEALKIADQMNRGIK